MLQHLALKKNILFVITAAGIILFGGLFILHSASVNKQPVIANGLLADIILTFPAVFYFLIVRPYKLRKTTMLLVFSCCCLVAYLVLPDQQKQHILQVRKLTVVIELVFVCYLFTRIKQVLRVYKAKQQMLPDAAYNLRASMTEVLGNLRPVKLLAAELSILRYGVLVTRRERKLEEPLQKFTVYRESGYVALFSVFVAVSVIEITGMHLLLVQNHRTVALITTMLSIYGTLFLIADISAIAKRPILITETQLILRTGIRWRAITTINNIESLTEIKNDFMVPADCYTGAVIKSAVNVLVTFKQKVEIERLYKANLNVQSILMSVDKFHEFKAAVNQG